MKNSINILIVITCTCISLDFILCNEISVTVKKPLTTCSCEVSLHNANLIDEENYIELKKNVRITERFNSIRAYKLKLLEEAAVKNNTNNENIKIENSTSQAKSAFASIEESKENSIPIFKVKKEDILNCLTIYDKQKLFFIAAKLSVDDKERVKDYLYQDKNGEGVLNSLNLLKMRLGNKDFSKVINIISKVVNIDQINLQY